MLEYYEPGAATADKKTFEAEGAARWEVPRARPRRRKERTEKPQRRGSCYGEEERSRGGGGGGAREAKKGKKGKKEDDEDDKNEKGNKKQGEDDDKGVELPKAVAGAVKEKFPGGKVVGAAKEGKGEKATYEVELRYKAATLEVVLTAKGEVVEVEVKGKKNEDQDDDKGGKKKGRKDEDDNEKGKEEAGRRQSRVEGSRASRRGSTRTRATRRARTRRRARSKARTKTRTRRGRKRRARRTATEHEPRSRDGRTGGPPRLLGTVGVSAGHPHCLAGRRRRSHRRCRRPGPPRGGLHDRGGRPTADTRWHHLHGPPCGTWCCWTGGFPAKTDSPS